MLVGAKAMVDCQDNSFGDMRTAMHKAASQGHEIGVKMLLEARCDVGVKDRDGLRAVDLASGVVAGVLGDVGAISGVGGPG